MAGRSSAGQHRVHSLRSTKKAWAGPRRLGPGVQGSPQREPGIAHGDSSRAEYARRKVESSFLERGLDRSPVAAGGTGCSPANGTPEELRRLASSLRVINSFTAPFFYDLPKRPPKISGVLTHRT